jgi:hypothetical protein
MDIADRAGTDAPQSGEYFEFGVGRLRRISHIRRDY